MKPLAGPDASSTVRSAGPDYILLAAVLLLSGLGVIMVYSASGVIAAKIYGRPSYFFLKQVVFLAAGVALMTAVAACPRRIFYRPVYLWLGAALFLLALTFTPLGTSVGGARRWLNLGVLTFQPLEAAKIALVLYLASFFSRKQEMVKNFSVGFLPPSLITGLFCLFLVAQPDFGGAVFLAGILILMSLAGGTRLIYLFTSLMVGVCLAGYLVVSSPYRFRRWFAFLDPFKDARDSGYQLVQSLFALGSGGWSGLGLGQGRQKLFFLPEAHNDFILAVLGEELGFAGMCVVFVCLAIILWRGFAITLRQKRLQDRFTAFGMTLVIGIGALLNVAVVLGAVPPKGVPLPFVSYGGSSLLVSFFCAGLLLNISGREYTP